MTNKDLWFAACLMAVCIFIGMGIDDPTPLIWNFVFLGAATLCLLYILRRDPHWTFLHKKKRQPIQVGSVISPRQKW